MDRCHDMIENILFGILLYLPVMSLLKFKSVCKFWYSVIVSPIFITGHLKYNNDEENNLIIYNQLWESDTCSWIKQLFLLSGSQYQEHAYIDFNRLLWHPVENIRLAGSFDGIVCLACNNKLDVALWNPALNQLRPLPQPSVEGLTDSSYDHTTFGIDIKTNDYKILKMFYFTKKYCQHFRNTAGVFRIHVEVYSLRENSWRNIDKNDVLHSVHITDFNVLSSREKGKCFWQARDANRSRTLLSFDFHDEVFETILLPYDGRLHASALSAYNDKIVYIRKVYGEGYGHSGSIEIWMLLENGKKEAWNKICNIRSLHSRSAFPLCLSKDAKFLFCDYLYNDDGEQRFCLYNMHTQEVYFRQFAPNHVIHYNPSLISIKSMNGEDTIRSCKRDNIF